MNFTFISAVQNKKRAQDFSVEVYLNPEAVT